MTSAQITTFDEAAYKEELIRAGLEPAAAAEVAAKTAGIRNAALETAAFKKGLVDAGMQPEKAGPFAEAAIAFNAPRPKAAPVTARFDEFKSTADILGPIKSKLPPIKTSPAAPAPEAMPPAETPAAPRKARRATEAKAKPADLPATAPEGAQMVAVFDYRNGELPERVRDLIEAHLAIEAQDAKSAGTLGFMTRSLAIATLPHRKTEDFRFVRRNGDFTLTMMTAHPQGLPYGTLPRLLLTWVCTEVAQKRERVLSLGNNLASYLVELGLHNTGGKRGDITRLKHAMTTLFSSVISCHYEGKDSFALQNVLLADSVDWWTPQNPEEAGEWQSSLQLSEPFYKECIQHTLPFDMRAIRGLRQSPLALDIYVWLTYRMSYLSKRTTIPWVALAGQFGSGYSLSEQGLRDFKRAFLRELKNVVMIYPKARVSDSPTGLVLWPSPPHVSYRSTPIQKSLGF